MEVYLIRHAESELNRDRWRIGGRSSWCELNEQGRAQARVLGEALGKRGITFDRVCSSTAVRAMQTARLMLDGMGIWPGKMETFHTLEEQTMGEWEGQARRLVYTDELVAHLDEHAWTFRAPGGGESQEDCAARLLAWLEEVARPSGCERIALVTHGMVIRSALVALLGLDRRGVVKIHVENTSITRLEPVEGGWRVLSRNDVAHLDAAGMDRLTGAATPTQVNAVSVGEEQV